MRCRRCDWVADPSGELRPREQLLEHAEQAGHPLCVCCGHSLAWEDQQTCEMPRPGRTGQPAVQSCLAIARDLLSGIVTMYFLDGRAQLGQLHGVAYDHDRPSAEDGRPLPGGDLLVLLGPGSEGWAEDALTSRDNDPSSVAFDLGYWETRWREARSEVRGTPGVASVGVERPKVVVRRASAYLETRTRWAAREHSAFPDYLDDLHQLHERLQRATGAFLRPVRAEAECFGCGADALVRELRDGRPCAHGAPPPWPSEWEHIEGQDEPRRRPPAEIRQLHETALDAWEAEHGHCKRLGGYADIWTCQRCGDTYDWTRYLLALGQRLRQEDPAGWGLPEQVGYVLGVNAKTVRGWADRGQVSTACLRKGDQRVRVWWDDARGRAAELAERRRRQAEREAERAERQSA